MDSCKFNNKENSLSNDKSQQSLYEASKKVKNKGLK